MVMENDCRHFFNLTRSLLDQNHQLDLFRKWLTWEGNFELGEILERIESIPMESRFELRRALSNGQMESKFWMLDLMKGLVIKDQPLSVCVVGGWCGLLPLLISLLKPFPLAEIRQVDLDSHVNSIATRLNWAPDRQIHFHAETANALNYDFKDYQVVVNTSCEHFTGTELNEWLGRLPSSCYVFLQSNNFFSEPSHVNCFSSVFKFRKTLDLRTYLFTGEMELEKYRRFMVVGITH